jgi:hypothetical protein
MKISINNKNFSVRQFFLNDSLIIVYNYTPYNIVNSQRTLYHDKLKIEIHNYSIKLW